MEGQNFNNHKGEAFKESLYNHEDLEFLAQINIGSHKIAFLVTFDTCSSFFWVRSGLMSPSIMHRKFDCQASDTCSIVDRLVDIKFGNKELTGSAVKDHITVLGSEFENFKFLTAHHTGSIPPLVNLFYQRFHTCLQMECSVLAISHLRCFSPS